MSRDPEGFGCLKLRRGTVPPRRMPRGTVLKLRRKSARLDSQRELRPEASKEEPSFKSTLGALTPCLQEQRRYFFLARDTGT